MPTSSSLREEAAKHRALGARARIMAKNIHQEEVISDLVAQALELEELAQELESQASALETKSR